MPKAIFFDLDHTLYDYSGCHTPALTRTLSYIASRVKWPIKAVQRAFAVARKQVHKDLSGQGSSHSRLLYFQKTIEALAKRTDPTLTLAAEHLYWQTFLSRMQLFPGVREFLATAKKRKIKLTIVTNLTAQIQLQKIRKLKIDRFIDFVITSEEAGKEKPAPAIFKLALKKVGVRPKEVWYIGDDQKTDIAGAKAIGIKSFHRDMIFKGNHEFKQV